MPSTLLDNPQAKGTTESSANLPFVLYVRKSTEADERQAQSLANQVDLGRELAEKLGVELLLVEDAHSAKEPGRAKFDSIIAMVDAGTVAGIICWHPDRLSRNEIDAAAITYRLRKGILKALHFVKFHFENTNEGILMLQTALAQSQYSSSKLVHDVTRGMDAKRKGGWYPHYAPPGYRNNTDELKGLKTISPFPEHFPLIRRVFDYFLTGAYTQEQLRHILNNQWGYRSRRSRKRGGRPMSANTFSRLLRNPFYAGICIEKGQRYRGLHTPMITMAEHQRVLELLKRLERVQPQRHEFAYTGTLYCGNCSRLFTAYDSVNRHGRSYTYYKCRVCRGETISEAALQAQLTEIVSTVALPAPVFREWAAVVIERHSQETKPKEEAVGEAQETTLAALEKQLANLRSAYSREIISEAEFVADRQRLLAQIATLQNETERREERHQQTGETAKNLLDYVANIQSWLDHPSPAVRRAVVRALGSNFRIDGKRVLLELHPLLTLVAAAKREIVQQFGQFELANVSFESTKKERLAPMNVIWSRIWSLVLTQAYEQELSFPRLQELIERADSKSYDLVV